MKGVVYSLITIQNNASKIMKDAINHASKIMKRNRQLMKPYRTVPRKSPAIILQSLLEVGSIEPSSIFR